MKRNKNEEGGVKKYRELDELKWELHDLLKKIIIKTDLGEISDDYTDTTELELGDINIISDSYYHDLKIETDEGEIDINHDLETAKKVFKEVEKRYEEIEETKESEKVKEKAEEIFNRDFKV